MLLEYESDDERMQELSETEQRSILSCLRMIASTPYASTPYLRDLGMRRLLPANDSPMEKNEYAAEFMELVEDWEERVEVNEVRFEDDNHMKVVVEHA